MANHIDVGELIESDPRHPVKHLHGVHQPGVDIARQIDLGDITGDHRPAAETEPGQEHFHLLGGGVLRLIQNDKGIIQSPAAHKSQRRHLDNAGVDQIPRLFQIEHIV